MTLRMRLSLILTLGLLVGLTLFGTLSYVFFMRQQRLQLNELLTRDLSRIQAVVEAGTLGIGEQLTSTSGSFTLQFVSSSGVLAIGEGPLLPETKTPVLLHRGDEALLVASAPWRIRIAGTEDAFNNVGTLRLSLDVTTDLLERRTLLRGLLFSGGVIAFAVSIMGILVLQQALAPLSRLAFQAQRINPAHPEQIKHLGPHDEVGYVARALNQALSGIRKRQQQERDSLAEIAHELAAPLTLVAGHLQGLRVRDPQDERLLLAESAANELLYTSKDLLTLARGELERTMDLQVLDLCDVAKRIAGEYGANLGELQCAELAGSPERLAQLVRNLVRNAVQAADEDKVTLSVHLEGEMIHLFVKDTGPGVPPEELEHLFDRYFTRRKQGGTGVGLSIAKQIAVQHGGDITVSSTLGEGTCFDVCLPSLEASIDDDDGADTL